MSIEHYKTIRDKLTLKEEEPEEEFEIDEEAEEFYEEDEDETSETD